MWQQFGGESRTLFGDFPEQVSDIWGPHVVGRDAEALLAITTALDQAIQGCVLRMLSHLRPPLSASSEVPAALAFGVRHGEYPHH
jgi:hypothetical protein